MRPLLIAIHSSLLLSVLVVAPRVRGEENVEPTEAATEGAVIRTSLVKTRLSLAAGIKIASERFPAGRVVEAYFQADGKHLLYTVELIVGADDHKEVRIDAISGVILTIDIAREESEEVELERSIAKAHRAVGRCRPRPAPAPGIPTCRHRAASRG